MQFAYVADKALMGTPCVAVFGFRQVCAPHMYVANRAVIVGDIMCSSVRLAGLVTCQCGLAGLASSVNDSLGGWLTVAPMGTSCACVSRFWLIAVC